METMQLYNSAQITIRTPHLKRIKELTVDKPISFVRKIFEGYPKHEPEIFNDYFGMTRQAVILPFDDLYQNIKAGRNADLGSYLFDISYILIFPIPLSAALIFDIGNLSYTRNKRKEHNSS